ncbi:hypothetical protein ES703_60353 [subsurface metagenome]
MGFNPFLSISPDFKISLALLVIILGFFKKGPLDFNLTNRFFASSLISFMDFLVSIKIEIAKVIKKIMYDPILLIIFEKPYARKPPTYPPLVKIRSLSSIWLIVNLREIRPKIDMKARIKPIPIGI